MITVITKDFELLNDIFKFMLARFKESKGMDKYIHIESMTMKTSEWRIVHTYLTRIREEVTIGVR